MNKFNNGCLLSPYDERDYKAKNYIAKGNISDEFLETDVPILNQGNVGSCVAHAIATYKFIQYRRNLIYYFKKYNLETTNIISKISNGRYSKVNLKDTEGLMVEIPNGSYVPATRLSVGTVDQMYISLRLSALEEISEEKMPIILDEAFAYFDNERLKNILKYLNNNFRENQIIIFTCSNREEKALKELKIDYNICNL